MKKIVFFFVFLWLGIMGVNAQSHQYDLNKDGDVNITDVTLLLDYVLGKMPVADAVDLGLPSGVKWASFNMGATKPEEFGKYYAWGETEEKEVYNWSTYIHCDGSSSTCHDLGSDISGTDYDVAHVKWGGNWCMPTFDDIKELLDNCTSEWTMLNGVNGRKFTSKINGKSIFLPAAGYRWTGDLTNAGEYGYFRSSTQGPSNSYNAYYLYFYSGYANWYDYLYRGIGQSVRPVEKPKINDVPAEAIDLGLPSGTKWASCNVGATKPEEHGDYIAWGETEEKEIYSQSTYKYDYDEIGTDISGTEYDVAQVKWGGNWRMPTYEQQKELLDNCTYEWMTLNGVNGRKFTSKVNGKSIFLPATGHRYDGEYGNYWSSTKMELDMVYTIEFNIGFAIRSWCSYWAKGNVRPVLIK